MVINRQFLFRHYWWVALVVTSVAIGLIIQLNPRDSTSMIGAVVAGGLGFCYFVQRQRLAETTLFKELFTEFNARYDKLNDELLRIYESDDDLSPESRQCIVDYFNLCAEEYVFFKEGFIHPEVWRSWCRGMIYYLDEEPFSSLWLKEEKTCSYYGLSREIIRKYAA